MYPQVFGKYVLERELSRGGMARVLLATLRGAGGFEKKLVVKQIRDELSFDNQFVRRFVEEAKTTVALSHPNIVPVYELGVEQGTYFLAMELVEGASVAELIRERDAKDARRVLTPEEGAYVGIEVCRALDYAHRRMKVVHRDITPRNVMLDEEGQIKLIDFGIAAPALVSGHEILGSPGHMPPEQVEGGELGPATDIFAVAVLLMEAWTGAPPFRRPTPEACDAAMREPHPKPSDFDPRLAPLDDAIARAMSLDARARQQEASELGRALRGFLQGLDPTDIARGLGDRVRELRERASVPAPAPEAGPRRSTASHGDLGTRTFAAREEALSWSSRPPAMDDNGSPSTRKLSESPPHPAAPPPVAPPPKRREDDPVMSIPTPLMVEVDELERIHEQIAAARGEGKTETPARPPRFEQGRDEPTVRRGRTEGAGAEKADTDPTRPLETRVREIRPSSVAGAKGARMGMVIAGILAVGAIGFFVTRGHGNAQPDPVRTVATTTTAPPHASVAPPPEPKTAPSVTASASMPSTTSAPAPSVTPLSVGVTTAAGKTLVTFLGEPGTRVLVDGVARGECPVRTMLGDGGHDVRFIFDPTGESRGERFTVKAGERLTVRADFTGATPTVRFQR